jgi:hypothetical protein
MRIQLGICFAFVALAWATPSTASFDADDYYLACDSNIGAKYTGTGRGLTYFTYLKIADLRQLPEPEDELDDIVLARFTEWAKATGQYGRWNSVWDSDFGCTASDAGIIERRSAVWASSDRDHREINLPPDWYKRSPSTASPAELARYSSGAPAPGLDRPNNASLTIAPSTPPVESGWDEKVRDQLRRDAAARAKSVAETARADARNQAQMARFFAEMKKRGSAQ